MKQLGNVDQQMLGISLMLWNYGRREQPSVMNNLYMVDTMLGLDTFYTHFLEYGCDDNNSRRLVARSMTAIGIPLEFIHQLAD